MESDFTAPDLTGAVLADHCHLRVPSMPDWIGPTVDYLISRALRCGAIESDRDAKLMIALHEALTNAIIHGNLGISSELKERGDDDFARAVAERLSDPAHSSRVVDIQSTYDGHTQRWVLHDQGGGFDSYAALRKLDDDPDPLKPSGRGLLLIRAFTDEMRYEDSGRRLVLTVRRSSEKRQTPRWAMSGPIGVTPLDDTGALQTEPTCEAIGRNVSMGGIAFLADGLAKARHVLLTIPGEQVEIRAEVRHWQTLDGNIVEVGCRFETPAGWQRERESEATTNALARLVEQLSERRLPQDERRAAPRVAYTERIEVELPGGEVKSGFGRDLSHGGISFLCTGGVPLDVVRLILPGNGEPIRLKARVVRSTRVIEGFYDVGAQFVPGS